MEFGTIENKVEQQCVNQELIQPLNDSMSEGPLLTKPTTMHTHTITCNTGAHKYTKEQGDIQQIQTYSTYGALTP